jgi:large repetitive protein
MGTGKYGGNVTVTYNVTIIAGGGTNQTLNTLIYDFSGSSYHYNADFSTSARLVSIFGPSSITIAKSFAPKAIAPGETSVMTFKLTNPMSETIGGVNFTDNLQGGLKVAATPNVSYNGCGPGSFSPVPIANATSLSFLNGTIAPNSTCTINVTVTADTVAEYPNTTGSLFINTSVNTGNTGTDTLKVSTTSACLPGQTLATWTFPTGSSATAPAFTTKAGNVIVATASTTTSSPAIETNTSYGNPAPSWGGQGFSSGAYFQFQVDTSKYTGVTISFNHIQTTASWNVSTVAVSSSTDGTTFTSSGSAVLSAAMGSSTFNAGAGSTYFRISATGAQNVNSRFAIDNVTLTGCLVPAPAPTFTKSFSQNPIIKGTTSTLAFTINNTAAGNVAQTGIAFTDVLPEGLSVANATTSVCNGTNNLITTASSRTIYLVGGSLAAGASCTFNVTVTGDIEGAYENITGFLSSNESGTSTSYATDTLTVIAPPTLAKSFSPTSLLVGETSELQFTITNPNQSTALTGIDFTDTLPSGVTAVDGSSTQCNGTLDITGGNLLAFTGGSLAANGMCNFSVTVTGASSGTKNNMTSAVTSTQGGNGAPASATMVVSDHQPLIGLLKQVSTDNTSWVKYVGLIPTGDIYYRFTITNDGETALDSINIIDPNVDMGTCLPALPSSLAVGDTVSCVVGPISISSDPSPNPFINTAMVDTGTYSPGDEGTSSAQYGTKSLSIDKSSDKNTFAYENEIVVYSYLVTNNGGYPLLGPVTVIDDKASVTCPVVDTVGDNDNYLDPGESITCTTSYSVQAADMASGSVTNTASATVEGVDSEEDTVTVARQYPDLTISKANDTSNNGTIGVPFTWTIAVSNSGLVDVTFADGQTLLSDPLPAGATYGSPTPGNFTDITGSANISCSIDGGNLLTCTASGSSVTLGASTGSFTVSFSVTPTAGGSLANTATVDPNNNIPEVDETNNTGSNTVAIDSVIIDAVDDDYSATPINGFMGGNAGNAFTNDTLNGVAVDPADITATMLTPASDPGVTLNTTTGSVDVAAGTPAGIYTIEYQICEVLNPANCDTATITVEVSSASINAVDDSAGPINGLIGATNVLNVFDNDTLNGSPVNPADVILTLQPGGDPELTLNTDGSVDVAPGTSAGTYAFDYEICEILNPTNCDIATVTVTVEAATIDAMDDDYSATPINGPTGGSVGNAFTNDILNGVAVNLGEITATVITPASNPGVTLNTTTGSVDVAAGTPAGIYTIEYEICDNLNPTNCDTAIITVTVEAASIFDPPSAIKTFNAAGLPELEFRMVWINSGNIAAIAVQVTDNIPTGTTYVPGSIACEPRGSSSNAAVVSSPLSVAAVPNSFCGFDVVNNRIQWQGNIGPDDGNFTEDTAANEVVITFRVTVNGGVNQVLNQSFSRTDVDADGDFDEETVLGTSLVGSNRVIWNRSLSAGVDPEPRVILPGSLPTTGFPPSVTTILPEQPASLMYSSTSVWLEIPSLDVRIAIVGVPLANGDWDVSWLGSQAGWLDGTAFPSWRGNSALTGHVTLSNGQSGPFANLENLKWGDRVIVHAYGFAYTYEVRENKVLVPNDTSVLKHEKDAWLTLVTCKNYNETTNTYTNRVSVRAVLISVQKEQTKNIPTGVR